MKKRVSLVTLVVLVILTALDCAAAQPSIIGRWEGTMTRDGAQLPVGFDFREEGSKLNGTFDSPTQRAIGIPLNDVTFANSKIHFKLVGDATTIIFDGELNSEILSGQFRENDAKGVFSLKRVGARRPVFTQEEVTFRRPEIMLSGTLLLPQSKGPHPAVVFLHGSGAEGRFAARFLAEHFTRHGIAALIYDKRGVGRSTGDWKRSSFDDLAGDAIAAIDLLSQRKEIDAQRIGIYGHSQGGSIAPMVASRSSKVAFVIAGAGGGIPMYEGEINSLTNQVIAAGISGADLADATAFVRSLVDVLRTGEGREQLEATSEKVKNTNWYQILRPPPRDHWFWAFYKRIADYNPADHWTKVTVPVLLVYGERDRTVPVAASISNIDRALGKAGNRDYTFVMLPRASHSFTIEPEPGQPFEWTRIAPGFPDLLTSWINQRIRK